MDKKEDEEKKEGEEGGENEFYCKVGFDGLQAWLHPTWNPSNATHIYVYR